VILGVYPTEAGFRSVTVKPYIYHPGISSASGKVPTPYGEIAVSWKVEGDSFTMDISMPQGSLDFAKLTVVLPGGETVDVKEESVHLKSAIRRDK
jgi:alpha-L-rhamnosidase